MIKKILVPLDRSELAAQALPYAKLQSVKFGAEIMLLWVTEPLPAAVEANRAAAELHEVEARAESYLEDVAKTLSGEGFCVEYCTCSGMPADSIITFADTENIDLIVMSTHGRSGLGRWVYGSVADKVLRAADVPVLLIRATEEAAAAARPACKRLLVPLDGSELAEQALPYAELLAHAFGAEVILLQVPTLPPYVSLGPDATMLVPSLLSDAYAEADAYLANVERRLRAKGLSVHKAAVEPGAVAETIIDYTHEAGVDYIVMSTHGRSGLRRWVYGSVADRVLRGADAPVLLVRAPREELSMTREQ
ncbi:MAG: Universal stress protein F [Anaerolineales bacterium]|nr:Universal stress protein F [Anaerolineales bacterium]